MNADREIEHEGQLGTDYELVRESRRQFGDGYGAAARAAVMEAVSAKSAANHLYPLWCAAVSAPGCEGDSR
jgi:hypothetical protein